tara:strand:+ start:2197 stop:2913 length:717 start_codon:yes stop_codon:yes gene_type:complete
MNNFNYTGDELQIFERAINWKNYYLSLCKDLFDKNKTVLEIGAGIGGISTVFQNKVRYKNWTMIEPDEKNYKNLLKRTNKLNKKNKHFYHNLTIEDFLKISNKFDLIILADVLEHLKNDKEILQQIFNILKPNGSIIIFVPAHQILYSQFDKKIGHYRRYSKLQLMEIIPKGIKSYKLKYIDSIGFFASLANKLILKSEDPSLRQIIFWDRFLVKLSRLFDRLLFYKFGKNIFCMISK